MAENNNVAGWPWWARAALYFGFPTVVAMFFMWEAHRLVDEMMRVTPAMILKEVITNQAEIERIRFDLYALTNQQNNIIRANCFNNARNELGTERCIYGLSEGDAKRMKTPRGG